MTSKVDSVKAKLAKQPFVGFILYLLLVQVLMVIVFFGCRPDRFLFGR